MSAGRPSAPSPSRRLPAVVLSLALVLGLLAVPAALTTSGAAAATPTPQYRNPLALQLPDGAGAASCADPFVLPAQAGDTGWYLYCTSDALSATELGPDGKPLIHDIPTYRSADLVHWTSTGDAFTAASAPSWATGGFWAPDVVYRGGRYLMYFTAPETTLPGGGSAIGVATSPGPTGPWTVQQTPVVEPEDVADGAPGDRRWTYDPEVLTVGSTSYLYFGSYHGGLFVRTLTADGLATVRTSETPIAIANRYEGTTIVPFGGWYYLLGSATNCCNGPLTGYAVFAGRSRSPLGPFVDRDGVSLLAGRVGGTPVLTQNGNRWVGTGHTAVVTDLAGQMWIFYHAVDRNDPYYAGDVGYTKRPVLADPLDWIGGWPTVRGRRGPSDQLQPGPVTQPGQRPAYRERPYVDPVPGTPIAALSDEFTGPSLSPQWSWVRPPSASTYSLGGGSLHWGTQDADLHPDQPGALASVLTEPAPSGDYVVETRVSTDVPPEGCCHNYVQGALLVYRSDADYVKLASASIWETRQTEFGQQVSDVPPDYPTYGNTVVGPVGASTYLRIVRQHDPAGGPDHYTAYTSLDGRQWDRGGTWTADYGSGSRIGLVAMGGAGFTATFDDVRVSRVVPGTGI